MAHVRSKRSRRRDRHPVERIAAVVIDAQVIIAFVLIALCHGGSLIGWEAMHVKTASMEPAIEAGALAYISPKAGSAVQQGDVVAFSFESDSSDAAAILHRVERVDRESGTLATKGDANDTQDPFAVPFDAVIGTCAASIPRLGALVETLSEHRIAVIGVLAACNVALIAAAHAASKRRRRLRVERIRATAARTMENGRLNATPLAGTGDLPSRRSPSLRPDWRRA